MRADRWIGYSRARQALTALEELLTAPARQRMPNLLIVGPTNNGKTMLVEKFRRDHPPTTAEDGAHEVIPVLVVQMPSEPDLKRLYATILREVHAPARPRETLAKVEDFTLRLLQQIGLRVLVLDEVHNILAGSSAQQRAFLNLLWYLGNTLRIPLVCVGTRDAYLAIRSDEQLENRFAPFPVPRWQADADYASLLASFEALLPLRSPSHLSQPPLAAHILTVNILPGMNAGASTYTVPSPIEGSGTAWVLLGSWALSPARPTPIHPRHECRGFSAFFGE